MKFLYRTLPLFFLGASAFIAAENTSNPPTVCFAENETLIAEFISLINEEQKSIQLATQCLRHTSIGKALIQAQKRGVHVEVIVDPFSLKSDAPLKKMVENKMKVYVWNPEAAKEKVKDKKIVLRHAFCIFGGKRVWTGSAYFSQRESSQSRSSRLILEQEGLAAAFYKEFEAIKAMSKTIF